MTLNMLFANMRESSRSLEDRASSSLMRRVTAAQPTSSRAASAGDHLASGCGERATVLTGLIIMISFQCECGKSHRVPDEQAGKRGRWGKACGNVLRIPGGRLRRPRKPLRLRQRNRPRLRRRSPQNPRHRPTSMARTLTASTTLTIQPLPDRPRPRAVGLVPIAPSHCLPSTRRFASSAAIT